MLQWYIDLLQSIHQIVNILSVIPALLIEHVQVDHGQERFPSSWKVSTYFHYLEQVETAVVLLMCRQVFF